MDFTRTSHAPGALARSRRLKSAMTRTETLLWPELRALGQNWRRQAPVGPFVADFCSHGRRLIVEVDGGVHRLTAARDAERDAWLAAQGYRVLRFSGRRVELELAAVVAEIRSG